MTRQTLPHRRRHITVEVEHVIPGETPQRLLIGIGYTGTPEAPGAALEAFATSQHKYGSQLSALMQDLSILISLALQQGSTLAELYSSLGTVPLDAGGKATTPASLAGTIVKALLDNVDYAEAARLCDGEAA